MFVDSALLRMGAGFSRSASEIAKDGAAELSETVLPAGIFGDFEEAHAYHNSLTRAQEGHVDTLRAHCTELALLSEKADTAAATFVAEDEAGECSIEAAGTRFT
ncbi:DUF2563 family protein [Mycolicibacterium goodii]|uniref:DUF2563 family protein n=1 Tax=Mycolicibacterium goodii TaxID=134601 RepID=UPI0009F88AB3